MKTNELELYYFGKAEFQKIREKHFSNLKEIIGVKELLNNQDLTDDEFEHKQRHIFDEIYKYISSNKRIRRDFYNAYGVVLIDTLCQFVLESLVADEVIKNNLKIDIFLEAQSLAFCGEDCPLHIFLWHEQGISLSKYSQEESHDYDCLDEQPESEIFGLEFEENTN